MLRFVPTTDVFGICYISSQTFYLLTFMFVTSWVASFGYRKAGGNSNMDVFLSQMAAHGYEGQPVLTDSCEFGLPARRRRLYVFLVRVEANPLLSFQDRSVDAIFSTFGALLSGCGRQGPCASQVLLADDHEAVRSDLQLRAQKRAELSSNERPVASDWADQHMKMAESLRVRWGQGARPELMDNAWYNTLTERERDAIPLLQAQAPDSLMRDLSQSIFRANAYTWKADVGQHMAPTMLPRMTLWLEPCPPRATARLMLGQEGLLFQGFPSQVFLEVLNEFQADAKAAGLEAAVAQEPLLKAGPKKAKQGSQTSEKKDFRLKNLLLTWRPTETLMQDLAGNAMSLPVVMTMLQCAFAAVNWQSAGEVRRAADAPVSTQQDQYRSLRVTIKIGCICL